MGFGIESRRRIWKSELAALPELARQKAAESGILAEAETALQKQLDERAQTGRRFNLVFQNRAGEGLAVEASPVAAVSDRQGH